MAGEIVESGTSESAEFEGQTEEQLGAELDAFKESQAPEQVEKPVEQAQQTQQTETEVKPPLDPQADRLAALEKLVQRYAREGGKVGQLEKKLAQLESLNKQPKQDLTPEQRTAQDQLNAYLEQFIQNKYGSVIDRLQQDAADAQYRSGVMDLCEEFEVPFDKMNPILGKVVSDLIAAAKGGDDVAETRLSRVLDEKSGSNYLFSLGLREYSKQVQTQGKDFQAGRSAQAQQAATTVRSASPPASKKAGLDGKTQADLDKMSADELGKELDAAGIR